MKTLTGEQEKVINLMADHYYSVVPFALQTYCSVTSRISRAVLEHYGIECQLLPCQIWLVTPTNNYVIGFVGKPYAEHKWDGHVICVAHNCFIDAALHHFTAEFNLEVPRVFAGRQFALPTQAIARVNLNVNEQIWWHRAPAGVEAEPPEEPGEMILEYSSQLIDRIEQVLGLPQHPSQGSLRLTA